MKKSLLLALLITSSTNIIAQVTAVGNGTVVPYRFVGWDGTGPGGAKVLDIKNEWNMPITFHTAGTQRMYINSDLGPNLGYIGIGNNFNQPASLLHVNSISNATGENFRTTAPLGFDHTWRMNSAVTDVFRFYIQNPSGSQHVRMVTDLNGEINFFTNFSGSGGARSVSFQNGVGDVQHGQVALGNNLPSGFNAISRLHLHKTDVGSGVGSDFIQFTNSNTTGANIPSNNSGFQVGIPAGNIEAYVRQNEDEDLRFFTNGEHRMVITSNNGGATEGYIYMGSGPIAAAIPTAELDIDGDLRIRSVLQVPSDALLLGLNHGPNADDFDVRRLDFSGVATEYLSGNGTWEPLPTPVGVLADNGLSFNTTNPNTIALGHNFAGGTGAELLNSREVPLNDYNIHFTGNSSTTGDKNRIIIGQTGGPTHEGKLHVHNLANNISEAAVSAYTDGSNYGQTFGVLAVSEFSTNRSTGVSGIARDAVETNIGVRADAKGVSSIDNTAFYGEVRESGDAPIGGANHLGLRLRVQNGNTSNKGIRLDVKGYDAESPTFGADISVIGGPTVYGIYVSGQGGSLSGGTTSDTYGIYANNGGGAPAGHNWAGYFKGNVHVQGTLTIPGGVVMASDQQFKNNINDLSGALNLIEQLQPRTFEFDTAGYADFGFESDIQMGLVAQEVETVIPTIISEHVRPAQHDSSGIEIQPEIIYKGIENDELIALLIAGMQEQQAMIDSLATELTAMKTCLDNAGICSLGAAYIQSNSIEQQNEISESINVELRNKEVVILNQNVPNPFAERTVITYSIPETIQKAQIQFFDGNGVSIKTVEISERGNGQVNVYAQDLSSGIYSYALIVDGRVVDSKKMMKR